MQRSTKFLVLLLASLCAVAYADRLPPDSDEAATTYILESPLYHPLARVALHVEEFFKGIPGVRRNAVAQGQRKKISSIVKNMNRIKPALQHVLVLAKAPQISDMSDAGNFKEIEGSFDSLRRMLTEAHRNAAELAASTDNVILLDPMQAILSSIQKALYHASSLSSSLVPTVYRIHPMMEKFVIHEYIPYAEKIFTIKENLQEMRNKSHDTDKRRAVEKLIDQWSDSHDRIKDSSISLLKMVDMLKHSMQKNVDPETLQHFSAFVSLLNNGDSDDKFLNLGADSINSRLNRVESSLLAIAHKKNPIIVPINKDKTIPFPMAVSMLHQIENMVEKLTHLHGDLHSTQDKLRYIAARLDRSKDVETDTIIKNNNAIRSQLNRLHSDVSSAHAALRNHMAHCIISDVEKSAPEIDFMSPMLRFAELEKKIKTHAHAERFSKDLEEIRNMLFKLHNDAHRFNRFEQIIKSRKAKIITQ